MPDENEYRQEMEEQYKEAQEQSSQRKWEQQQESQAREGEDALQQQINDNANTKCYEDNSSGKKSNMKCETVEPSKKSSTNSNSDGTWLVIGGIIAAIAIVAFVVYKIRD